MCVLLTIHSAAAVDHLSCDIGGKVTCQEQGYIRNIVRSSSSSKRYLLLPILTNIFRKGACHVSGNESRRYAV